MGNELTAVLKEEKLQRRIEVEGNGEAEGVGGRAGLGRRGGGGGVWWGGVTSAKMIRDLSFLRIFLVERFQKCPSYKRLIMKTRSGDVQ